MLCLLGGKCRVRLHVSGADPGGGGGGPGPPLSESLGIDFYSGYRKKIQVYTFIVASEEMHK